MLLGCAASGVQPDLVASTVDGVLFVCDSSDDRVLVLEDLDGSGMIEPDRPGEIRVFYDDSSPGPDLSTPSHLLAAEDGKVILLDGGTLDSVLILMDANGDGDANDDGEVKTFYSSDTGPLALGTPNTLVRGPDGALYIADDGSAARRVLRLEDLNDDGDAEDEGEAVVVYDTAALSTALPEDIESLAFDSRGAAYVGDTTQGTVYRLVDSNGDGDFLDEEEVEVFYRSDEEHPIGDADCLAVMGSSVLVCDEDTGSILRLRDANEDGIAQVERGEVSVFLDTTASVRVSDTNDFTILPGGVFLVLDGKLDTVFVVRDLNADEDALDEGEVFRWLVDDGESLSTPSGLAFLPYGEAEITGFVRGDVSGDGSLDLADPVALLGILFLGQSSGSCQDAQDADDNGAVNIADAVMLLNYLFAGGSAPPEPFPGTGDDPTPDSLECDSGHPV